ncbi:MAG TPA: hypothetical protein VFV14_06455, partial [Myxococcaceae bacterium]|nr:hypothetical protein [Myxococcaceae bacterium]
MAIRYASLTLIAVGALYLTIWPHELGHSLVAYLYGCKANWWQTDTSWFLWGSQGGAIDYACLDRRGRAALGMTDFGGIAVNLILLALAVLQTEPRVWLADRNQSARSDEAAPRLA